MAAEDVQDVGALQAECTALRAENFDFRLVRFVAASVRQRRN